MRVMFSAVSYVSASESAQHGQQRAQCCFCFRLPVAALLLASASKLVGCSCSYAALPSGANLLSCTAGYHCETATCGDLLPIPGPEACYA